MAYKTWQLLVHRQMPS